MVENRKINGVTIKFTDESKALPSVVAVSTVKIAKIFEKDHKEVLKDFRKAIQKLDDIGEGKISPSSEMPLFADIEYTSEQNKQLPAMAVSERLFYQVVLAYTGDKAFILRKEFIDAFFDMRLQLMEATVAFQNRSSSQRDRRRREMKDSHEEILRSLVEKIDEKNILIAQCIASLQDDVK